MEEGNGDKSNKKSRGTMKIQKLGWLWCSFQVLTPSSSSENGVK
jgi:hypothetical protein